VWTAPCVFTAGNEEIYKTAVLKLLLKHLFDMSYKTAPNPEVPNYITLH